MSPFREAEKLWIEGRTEAAKARVAEGMAERPLQLQWLELHLRLCAHEGAPPAIQLADDKCWAVAVDGLIKHGWLESATFAAPRLHSAFPHVAYFATLHELLSSAPAPRAGEGFRNDPAAAVQVAPHPGATTAVLAFKGPMSINIEHRWMARLGAHIVYLKDLGNRQYRAGLPGLGSDIATAAAGLRSLCRRLGAERIVCTGASAGGYGALAYGPAVGAEAVLALSPLTSLRAEHKAGRSLDYLAGVLAVPVAPNDLPSFDVRPLYEQANHSTRAHVVYPTGVPRDVRQASQLQGLRLVILEPLEWDDHNVVLPLIRSGRWQALLNWVAGGQAQFGVSNHGPISAISRADRADALCHP